jgi:hypothetical protein
MTSIGIGALTFEKAQVWHQLTSNQLTPPLSPLSLALSVGFRFRSERNQREKIFVHRGGDWGELRRRNEWFGPHNDMKHSRHEISEASLPTTSNHQTTGGGRRHIKKFCSQFLLEKEEGLLGSDAAKS